jgi:hypothetical protein
VIEDGRALDAQKPHGHVRFWAPRKNEKNNASLHPNYCSSERGGLRACREENRETWFELAENPPPLLDDSAVAESLEE